jgi:hypothetical protein
MLGRTLGAGPCAEPWCRASWLIPLKGELLKQKLSDEAPYSIRPPTPPEKHVTGTEVSILGRYHILPETRAALAEFQKGGPNRDWYLWDEVADKRVK